jgi:hypothetical protein
VILAEVSGEAAKAGPMAILVIAVLCIATYLLFRSMSRHLRRVREDFPGQAPREPQDEAPREPRDEASSDPVEHRQGT